MIWLPVSKRESKVIFLDIKQKNVGLWGSYVPKKGNPLQNFKTTYQIVFVWSDVLFFYFMYQKGDKKKDILRLNKKSVVLWGRYSLKPGNPLYFFHNMNPIVFVMFISLFFDLLYKRVYQG